MAQEERICEIRSLEFGTFELRPGGALRIGRHRENDVVISDTMVSRFHARLAWDRELPRPILYENGSQNGTTIDGARVRNADTVRDEARIGIGPYVLRVKLHGCADTPALLRDTNDLVTLFSEDAESLAGDLTPTFTARHLLQRLETERRTGTLTLEDEAGGRATVIYCLGRVMSAEVRDGSGLRALERVVRARGGRFRFTGEFEPLEDALNLWVSDFLRARNLDKGESTQRFSARDGKVTGIKPKP